MKRHDVVTTLKKLLPICREGEARYEALAHEPHDMFKKALYIRYWQKYAQCASELEDKIRAHGGDLDTDPENPLAVTFDYGWHHYEQALAESLPIDVQMLLQRHLLIFKEEQKRMEAQSAPLISTPVTPTA